MTAEVEDGPRPDGETLTRVLGGAVALAAFTTFTTYVAVPVGRIGEVDVPALVDLNPTYRDIGTVVHCLLMATVGLGVALRPILGRGVLLAAAVPLPWVLGLAGGVLDTERASGRSVAVLKVVEGAGLVLALALLAALVLTAVRLRPPPGGLLLADGIALVVGVSGLWATVATNWYEIAQLAQPMRFGGLLDTESWAGRGAWAGLVLAVAAVVVAVVDGGSARRTVGVALVVVLVVEALRRTVLSSDGLLGESARTPFGLIEARPVVGLIAFQLLGAAAGAWLATTAGDDLVGDLDDPDDDPVAGGTASTLPDLDPGPVPSEPPAPAGLDALPPSPPEDWPTSR